MAFPRGAHQESLIDGVIQYAKEKNRYWTYVIAPESLSLSITDLRGWQGDGVIAALNTPTENECAGELNVPVVNISSVLSKSSVPQVLIDNRLVGEIAADHLINRGYQEFGYYGLKRVDYSKLRGEGFANRLAASGFECNTFLASPTFRLHGVKWQEQFHALASWIQGLKTPVAIFAVTDSRAMQVLDACRQSGHLAPQLQIAVLGVDNEEIICQHLDPTLSSVARNNKREGYYAASMLDQMMRGKRKPKDILIPPLDVVQRDSTAMEAIHNKRIGKATKYIHEHIEEPFNVNTLAKHVKVSRSWLEYEFRDTLGESPHQYIRRQRLEQARRLLSRDRRVKLYEIAKQTGFGSAKHFTVLFHEKYGMSPKEYQRSV